MSHFEKKLSHSLKKTAIASAIAITLGGAFTPGLSSADVLTFNFSGIASDGLFTILNGNGIPTQNTSYPYYGDPTWGYGVRTQLSGTFTIDTADNSGSAVIQPFDFFAAGPAIASNITFTDAGVNTSNGHQLLLVNMSFSWNNNIGIPVSLVWDIDGLITAINGGLTVGDSVTTGALPASELIAKGNYPIGPSPVATTTMDTNALCTPPPDNSCLGVNPIATEIVAGLPGQPADDGIGGSPMVDGPFAGFNANFDLTTLTLISDGSGSITAPPDVSVNVPEDPPQANWPVDLGAPTDVLPPGTAEYCTETVATCDTNDSWIANDGTNTIIIPITQTVNQVQVDWRAGGGVAFDTQSATATVSDTTPPVIQTEPDDFTIDVPSTSVEVCFAGSDTPYGMLTATDAVDPDPIIEYSLTGFTGSFVRSNPVENCSSDFGPNQNTVFWQARDASGNITPYEQTVILNLPSGIVGKACEINLTYEGFRDLAGNFIMRNPNGSQVGVTDNTVTGEIDTFPYPDLCTEQGTDICPVEGASLETTQPFEGLLWTAAPIWLYGPGDWTFEACPGDASTQCDGSPRPLGMTVLDAAANNGVPQLGAHMLFEWGSTQAIDVVVVWDVDCGTKQLTTTDPDGDGILGTPMVDGPFIGFNAAFDQSATGVNAAGDPVPLIADGGYVTSIPAYKNPEQGASPLPLDFELLGEDDFPKDPEAGVSCIGGCYAFETDGLINATDDDGDYQFAQVVLPLDGVIPFWSLYRKFDEASQTWMTMVPDSRNNVKTAFKDDAGFCPEPGSGSYKEAAFNSQLEYKLEENTNCVQLTIENNGPYDSNPAADTVADPGGVLRVPAPSRPDAKTTGNGHSGGCSLASNPVEPAQRGEWWLLGGLLAFMGWRRRKQQH